MRHARWLSSLLVLWPAVAGAGVYDTLPANMWQQVNPPARSVIVSTIHHTNATLPDA